ncbi:ThiF family adenylyltransferase [Mycolicibacterium vulneris]|uniref:ThiF family adenylyltransferase n=1 Tax=Mycolicibacterium vulneris TaxID=547163 RepID=UPI001FEAFA26|nr:ThiF family adenylyltransferase [Mycolicibacterium vulneris]
MRIIAGTYPDDVRVVGCHRLDKAGSMRLQLRLCTQDIERIDGGIPLGAREDIIVTVGRSELAPPRAEVEHLRFLHHPHVLQGHRLCLYLDPSREWDPLNGFGGFLDRLFAWLADAAAARFDAETALYHAVGGVLHADRRAPTIVAREPLHQGARAHHGWLLPRTPHRFDLTLVRPAAAIGADHTPVVFLDADLPFGAGSSLAEFLYVLDNPYLEDPEPDSPYAVQPIRLDASSMVLTALGASAIRKADGSPQRLIIAVPHPTGGPPHLLAANIPAAGADQLRALIRTNKSRSPLIDIDRTELNPNTPMQWWPLSDERAEVTTRRDARRPVATYEGKKIAIWGCGGLGSWIAEYVVRAGANEVLLCDPGTMSGGLLVRQNFVEADIGNTKVEALAQRLRAISDTVAITTHDTMTPPVDQFASADLIIDATVSIAIARLLDGLAGLPGDRPVLAQVATDSRTGTLGILTVSAPPTQAGPLTIDRNAGEQVCCDGSLEAFHSLWDLSAPEDQIIPTRGCSTPTFHASAADLAAVAASLTSILGAHLKSGAALSGTHLISLPHGEAGPLRTFVPAPHADEPQAGPVIGAASSDAGSA